MKDALDLEQLATTFLSPMYLHAASLYLQAMLTCTRSYNRSTLFQSITVYSQTPLPELQQKMSHPGRLSRSVAWPSSESVQEK